MTLLEALPTFLGRRMSIAKEAAKLFAKQGLKIELGVNITKVERKKTVSVQYGDKTAEFDRLIVSIGRVPNTEGLNAAGVGLALDERGFIAVDEHCRTNLPGVWAIGDVVRADARAQGRRGRRWWPSASPGRSPISTSTPFPG